MPPQAPVPDPVVQPDAPAPVARIPIVTNKEKLQDFILNLCGHTLDEARYRSADYAFHLHIAFRRQVILKTAAWEELCKEVTEDHLFWQGDLANQARLENIRKFAQSVVDDVKAVKTESWGMRLIKTGYLSKLDKALENSEKAKAYLNDPDNKEALKVLDAHIQYLNKLLILPFKLEEFFMKLAEDSGHNYAGQKNAEVLASILSTLQLCTEEDTLIPMLITAVKIAMPTLPVGGDLLNKLQTDLLPYINTLVQNSQTFEAAKSQFFSHSLLKGGKDKADARKELLATMGVQFDSLQDILTNCLLDPIQECSKVATGLQNLAEAASSAYQSQDYLSRFSHISNVFANFDQLARVSGKIDQGLLPVWLQDMNRYYEACRSQAEGVQAVVENVANVAYEGFGIFYQKIISFLPESVALYFQEQASNSLVNVLNTFYVMGDHTNVKIQMAYLAFYELEKNANLSNGLNEKLFKTYMAELAKKTNDPTFNQEPINDYTNNYLRINVNAIDSQNQALNKAITKFLNSDRVFEKKNIILAMVHRLKTMEGKPQNDLESMVSMLEELTAAFHTIQRIGNGNVTFSPFKTNFLIPSATRILNAYLQKKYIPLLEYVIDNADDRSNTKISDEQRLEKNRLASVYKKIRHNALLTDDDYNLLNTCFPTDGFDVEALGHFLIDPNPAPNNQIPAIPNYQTPNQVMASQIQEQVRALNPMLEAIVLGLEKQQDNCRKLKKLCASPNDSLHKIASKKDSYITALRQTIMDLQIELTDPTKNLSLAKHIQALMNGEALNQAKDEALRVVNTQKMSVVQNLLRFAWHISPNQANAAPGNQAKPDNSFLNNVLTHILGKDNYLATILRAQASFADSVNEDLVPELTYLLNDPLAITNIMPSQEQILDKVVARVIGLDLEKDTVFSWAGKFLGQQAKALVASIQPDDFVKLFPFPFVGNIALQILKNPQVQEALGKIMQDLTASYSNAVADKALDLAEDAKRRIYSLIGVELQQSLETKALAYDPDRNDNDSEVCDAFALFYLRYRALKEANPNPAEGQAHNTACIKRLFNGISDQNLDLILGKFNAFDALNFIGVDGDFASEDASEKTKAHLLFLVQHLDFNDPNSANKRLILINNLVLMLFEASQQAELERSKAIALQQFATLQLAEVLRKKPELRTIRSPIDNAKKRAKTLYQEQLDSTLKEMETFIKINEQDRDEQLKIAERLDQNATIYEFKEASPGKKNLIVLSKLAALFSFTSLWAAIITPLVVGGLSTSMLLESGFAFFGVSGLLGLGATLTGGLIFVGIALARLAYKMVVEVHHRRDQFKQIETEYKESMAAHPDRKTSLSLLKGLQYTGLILKCLGVAFVKTIGSDYILGSLKFLYQTLTGARRLLKKHPSGATLQTEKQALSDLKTQIEQVRSAFLENNLNLTHVDTAFKDLKGRLDATQTALVSNLGVNDARNCGEYTKPLTASIDRFKTHLSTLQNTAEAFSFNNNNQAPEPEAEAQAPEIPVIPAPELAQVPVVVIAPEHPELVLPVVAEQPLAPVANITVNIDGYRQFLQTQQPAQPDAAANLAANNPGYITIFVSGFNAAFDASINNAKQIFSWWIEPTPQLPPNQEALAPQIELEVAAAEAQQRARSLFLQRSLRNLDNVAPTPVQKEATGYFGKLYNFFAGAPAEPLVPAPIPAPLPN